MAFEWLKDYVRVVDEALEKWVPAPPHYPEHTYGPIKEYVFRGGKRLRPVLAMVTSEAFGGSRDQALMDGIIIELFHNFTLIHDDIEDGSKLRRGKPTLHEMYGIPWALNVGDALYTYVWGLVLDRPPFHRKRFYETFKAVVEGQGLEIYLETFNVWELEERHYFDIVERKTAALIAHSAGIGAYNATGQEEDYWRLHSILMKAGVAFQIRDDVLNVVGEEGKYGKEIGGDITEGKRTLLVIHALSHLPREKAERLKDILSKHTDNEEEIKEAIALMKEAGSIAYAQQVAERYAGEALRELEQVDFADREKAKLLKEIIYYIVGREL